MGQGLRDAIPETAVHLCVDMQRMFVEDTAWRTPWAERVLPVIVRLCEAKASAPSIVSRSPGPRPAVPLQRFVPPGRLLDKRVYSPWMGADFDAALRRGGVDTLVVTGAETDVCVLATVLGAIDLGYRTVVVTDALGSSSDESHDALMDLYHERFSQQVETADSAEILGAWR